MELQAARYTLSYTSASRVSSNVFYVHAKNALWCHCTDEGRVSFKIICLLIPAINISGLFFFLMAC